MNKVSLNDRMKNYEAVYKIMLPKDSYYIVRLDGKAFHTFTKQFKKPFDKRFRDAMRDTAKFLASRMQGCIAAYTQSDEITLVLTDRQTETTQSFFNGNLQKIISVTASICTAKFNELINTGQPAYFDSRVFIIDEAVEVYNCLYWRYSDCIRNAKQTFAQTYFSHKQLHGLNVDQCVELCKEKGHIYDNVPVEYKYGYFFLLEEEGLKEYIIPDLRECMETILENVLKY